MMASTEPPDPKRLGVIIMMRVSTGMSADLASLPDQLATLETALHREMGTIFRSVLLAPIRLSRFRCRFRLSHHRPHFRNHPDELIRHAFVEQLWATVSPWQACCVPFPVIFTPRSATSGIAPVLLPPG